MAKSKHVFFQVDTDAIIRNIETGPPTKSQVREHTFIYDQGLMAVGHAVKNFDIYINQNNDDECHESQDVYFTILPLHLYSYHKIYFTGFEDLDANDGISINPRTIENQHQITLKVTITKALEGKHTPFNLFATIDYYLLGSLIQIPICIDPVLKADQR